MPHQASERDVRPMRGNPGLVAGASAALIASAAAALAAQPVIEACATRPDVLGLSRIVEVDTSSGPMFGKTPAGGFDILKDGEVILTFDDGPSRSHTPAVLKALAAQCTKATFFMVGRMAAAEPAMVREVAKAGHTVGVHTWSHAKLQGIADDKMKDEIERGLSMVSTAMQGPIAPFFRFPYLRTTHASRAYLTERHVASFGIDVDSRDFETRDGNAVKEKVLAQLAVRHKGIVLFHDIQASTAGSILEILAALKAHGYKVVHVVPKAPATTLAKYDAFAEQELAKRRHHAANEPLAPRSLVWPQSDAAATGNAPKEALPWAQPSQVKATVSKTAGSTKSEAMPWFMQWLQP
jgi:peptidoglycan/xylan/chitin deacetylase (PgdA/CDA1 family)